MYPPVPRPTDGRVLSFLAVRKFLLRPLRVLHPFSIHVTRHDCALCGALHSFNAGRGSARPTSPRENRTKILKVASEPFKGEELQVAQPVFGAAAAGK